MQHVPSPVFSLRSSNRRSAFSLLEVAIALVIFVIGAIALLRIFPSGLNVLENSSNRRIAAQMSQNVQTSYNSGDLSSTAPDAIYDADYPDSYPSSVLGLRRQSGTVPISRDDFNSAKDAMKFISGEKQGVSNNTVYTNYIADGQVGVSREGVVSGVRIDPLSGKLDFRNARYQTAQRPEVDSRPSQDRPVFREPILIVSSVTSTALNPVSFSAYSPQLEMSYKEQADTFKITLKGDLTLVPPLNLSTLNPSIEWFGGGAAPTGFSATVSHPSGDELVVDVNVPASPTPTGQTSFKIDFGTPPTSIDGLSLNSKSVLCVLRDSRGGTPTAIQAADPLLPILAPKQVRGDNVTYYVSSTWNNGAGGAFAQPMIIPDADAQYPNVPSKLSFTPDETLIAPLTFLQRFGPLSAGADRTKVVLTGGFQDVDAPVALGNLSQVSLSYNVRSWEFIAEDVAQFGTPFTGSSATIDASTPEGAVMSEFMTNAGYTAPIPLSEVREVRTRVGNLRGVVLIKGFYGQDALPLDVASFDTNSSTVPPGSTVSPVNYVRQKKALAKEGRLYLPATYTTPTGSYSLSHARVYYRSKDAWVQQIGVAAPHYVPFIVGAPAREPWREYVQHTDGYLYFRAADAGKTVEVLQGTNPANARVDTVEIQSNVLVDSVPTGFPTGFVTAFTNSNNANDPRNGKTFLARSRNNRFTDTIFDVRRPTGTSGISVRTMWLDGERYAQEVAQ